MENLSLYDDVEEVKMREWLFQCVREKKLDPIRKMMSRLPLPERRTIIFSLSANTSLLAHAYAENAVQIVEYFIKECDANVHESCILNGKWLPPLYLSVKTGCLPMVLMLLKLGAKDIWFDDEERNAIVYACQVRNLTIAHVLQMYGSNINCDKNIKLCARNMTYCFRAFGLGTDVNHCTTSGNSLFIEAVLHNNSDLVKLLKSKNADIYYRNNDGANALDLLIWNKKLNMVSFLMNENIYSVSDLIFGYDFCGARKVFENKFTDGIRFWLMATKLRRENIELSLYDTFPCHELLDLELEYDEDAAITTDKFRKALEIYLRLHSPQNMITKKAFCHIAMSGHYNAKNSYVFLRQLFCLNISGELPEESAVSYSVRTAIEYAERALSSIHDKPDCLLNVFEQFVEFIRKYMHPFLNEHTQQIPYYFSLYKYQLYVVLRYIDYFINSEFESEDNLFELLIHLIAPIYFIHYPTSLLLLAISRGFALKLITLLLECKSDLHVVDENLNNPLHLAGQRPNNIPDRDKLSMLLISAGCDIGAENIIGYTPVNYFKT